MTLIPSKLTDEVVSRYKDCPDPRLKEIMISLVKHLHSFAREVKLTEAEWIKGVEFVTRVRTRTSRNSNCAASSALIATDDYHFKSVLPKGYQIPTDGRFDAGERTSAVAPGTSPFHGLSGGLQVADDASLRQGRATYQRRRGIRGERISNPGFQAQPRRQRLHTELQFHP